MKPCAIKSVLLWFVRTFLLVAICHANKFEQSKCLNKKRIRLQLNSFGHRHRFRDVMWKHFIEIQDQHGFWWKKNKLITFFLFSQSFLKEMVNIFTDRNSGRHFFWNALTPYLNDKTCNLKFFFSFFFSREGEKQ